MRSEHLLPFALVPAATVLLPTPAAFADAQVRFLQATPGADQAGLTVVSGDRTVHTTPMAFAQLSDPVRVPAGRVELRHHPADSERLVSAHFTLRDHRQYTVVAVGPPGDPELKLRRDGRAEAGEARVRVAHFARELGAPDLFVDGERVAQRVPYLDTTPYVTLSPGSHTLAAMRPNSTSTLVSARVTLHRGTTSTAYVLGSGGQPTQTLLASDATGSPRKAAAPKRGTSSSSRAGRVHVVKPGDTLWGIAADGLGADASDTDVFHEVQRLWLKNGAHIGTGDPDLIRPGQRIHLS